MKHLTTDELSVFLDGALPAAKNAEAEGHLESCASCREALAALEAQDRSLRETLTHDPGDDHFELLAAQIEESVAKAARGDLPPVKVFWYEGLNKTTTAEAAGNLRKAQGDARNLPPLLLELRQKYPDEELDRGDSGTLYVGEKGVIFTGTYGDKMHIVPYEKMKETPAPPKTLPRPKGIFADFIEACHAGRTDTAVSFEYGTRLTEFAILGNLAQRAGEGKKLEWDEKTAKVTNAPEAAQYIQREYRKGWTL